MKPYNAIACDIAPLRDFKITVSTTASTDTYRAQSASSIGAFMDAANAQGDAPCGITVTPAGASA